VSFVVNALARQEVKFPLNCQSIRDISPFQPFSLTKQEPSFELCGLSVYVARS
jgi:hypothetical protein